MVFSPLLLIDVADIRTATIPGESLAGVTRLHKVEQEGRKCRGIVHSDSDDEAGVGYCGGEFGNDHAPSDQVFASVGANGENVSALESIVRSEFAVDGCGLELAQRNNAIRLKISDAHNGKRPTFAVA